MVVIATEGSAPPRARPRRRHGGPHAVSRQVMGPAPAKPPPPIMPPAIIPHLVLHIMPGPGSLVTRPVARSIRSSTAPDACALLADRGVVHGGMMGGLRLRWRVALPLKRFAAPLELLLADLPAG